MKLKICNGCGEKVHELYSIHDTNWNIVEVCEDCWAAMIDARDNS